MKGVTLADLRQSGFEVWCEHMQPLCRRGGVIAATCQKHYSSWTGPLVGISARTRISVRVRSLIVHTIVGMPTWNAPFFFNLFVVAVRHNLYADGRMHSRKALCVPMTATPNMPHREVGSVIINIMLLEQ